MFSRKTRGTFAVTTAAIAMIAVSSVTAWAHDDDDDDRRTSSSSSSSSSSSTRPGAIEVDGDPVENIRPDASGNATDFCQEVSDLPPGEGQADKGGTCVSTQVGEVAKNPVRVTATTKARHRVGKPIEVDILVADNQGVMDLNAFTSDASGGAGVTLHEHPGELDEDGRPLMHCHLGVVTVERKGALPGEDYNAAFSGVQGVKGDVTATISGLPRGSYRGDVYCSAPGHPQLLTSSATKVQAFDTFDFRVVGRR